MKRKKITLNIEFLVRHYNITLNVEQVMDKIPVDDEVIKVTNNIRRIRNEKGISIVKLSVDSGISRSHLFYIETNKTSPTIDTLAKIAKALDIQLIDLFK